MRASRVIALSALLASAGWGSSLVQQAPESWRKRPNPVAEEQGAGAKLYRRECIGCHGMRSKGIGTAPPLVTPVVQGASDGALFWVLRNGAVFHGMPSFAYLPEARRWQIVTFVKTLR